MKFNILARVWHLEDR